METDKQSTPDLGDLVIVLPAGTLAGLRDRLAQDGFPKAADLVARLVEEADGYLDSLESTTSSTESRGRSNAANRPAALENSLSTTNEKESAMPDMDQVMRDYYERTRAERDAARQRLIDACNKHRVAKVEIEFDGCGDEGSTQMATSHDPEVEAAAEDYAYFVLEEHYPGWEINDGSSGTIRIDLAAGKLDIEFGSRYTDVEWSNKEVSL